MTTREKVKAVHRAQRRKKPEHFHKDLGMDKLSQMSSLLLRLKK